MVLMVSHQCWNCDDDEDNDGAVYDDDNDNKVDRGEEKRFLF